MVGATARSFAQSKQARGWGDLIGNVATKELEMTPELAKALEGATDSDYYQYLVDGKVDAALKRIAKRYWYYLGVILALTAFFLGYKFWDFKQLQSEIETTKAELIVTKTELEQLLTSQRKVQEDLNREQKDLSVNVAKGQSEVARVDGELTRLGGDAQTQKLVLTSMNQLVDGQTRRSLEIVDAVRRDVVQVQGQLTTARNDLKSIIDQGHASIDELDKKRSEIGPTPPDLISSLEVLQTKVDELDVALKALDKRGKSRIVSQNTRPFNQQLSHPAADYRVGLFTLGVPDSTREKLNAELSKAGYGFTGKSASLQPEDKIDWLAQKSTVFYYATSSMTAAKELSHVLKRLTGDEFVVRRGAGGGVDTDQQEATLVVHYVTR